MNNLNSILLEGDLIADPECDGSSPLFHCRFTIKSRRTYKEGEETRTTEGIYPIRCNGRLAEVCGEYLKKGRGVRVVGRLSKDSETGIFIMSEHVEFKPTKAPVPALG